MQAPTAVLSVIAVSLLSIASIHVQADPLVSVKVGPAMSFEPATVRLTLNVLPRSANRVAVIEADSGDQFTSSEVQLDGDQSARTHQLYFRDLPAGSYDVRVVLLRADGSKSVASDHFVVVPRTGD